MPKKTKAAPVIIEKEIPVKTKKSIEVVSADPRTVQDSPFQPRKTYDPDHIAQLTENVKIHGIQQPPKARRVKGGLELVFGHCRKRAAIGAGLKEIKLIVEDMTDEEVILAQLVENSQRQDPHPLEESEAYEMLHNVHKLSIDDLAAKISKSKPYIYRRLTLHKLCEPGRKALRKGFIRLGVAELIARLSTEEQQTKAVKEISNEHDPMTIARARDWIERNILLCLKDAPFSTRAKTLVPAAGACSECPKRTGANPDLFGDFQTKDDCCTDAVCWAKKVEAHWKKTKEKAKAAGQEVIDSKKEIKKLFPYSWSDRVDYSSGFSSLDDTVFEDGKTIQLRTKLKRDGVSVPTVIAKGPDGAPIELVRRSEITKARKAAGLDKPSPKEKAEKEKAKRLKRVQKRYRELCQASLQELPQKLPNNDGLARTFALITIQEMRWSLDSERFIEHHDIKPDPKLSNFEAIQKWLKTATAEQAWSVFLSAFVSDFASDSWEILAEHFGIDPGKIQKQAEKDIKAEDAAKASKAKKGKSRSSNVKKASGQRTKRKAGAKS